MTADFIVQNHEVAQRWHDISNSIILLEVDDAEALSELYVTAKNAGLNVTEFREPDFGDAMTAIAFQPHEDNPALLADLSCSKAGTEAEEKRYRANESTLRRMSRKMEDCDQTKGQNVLQHGRSVREHYFTLLDHIEGKVDLGEADNWKLPEWIDQYRTQILSSLPSRYVMDRYLTLHDCGKPDVLTADEEGRRHFPGHADASEKAYRQASKLERPETREAIAWLIKHDMDIHMVKAAGMEDFSKDLLCVAQVLAGLSEVTSNASMFGGVGSTSFKIKYKQMNQRGKQLMKILFPHVNV